MSSSFRKAYSYARVCGSVAHARLGGRAMALTHAGRVVDIWHLLFEEAPPALPEGLLVAATERRIRTEAHAQFVRIAGAAAEEEEFLRALQSKAEFAYVKLLIAAARSASPTPPIPAELPLHTDYRPGKYPELVAMFGGSRFAWIADQGFDDLAAAKNRLDCQYYRELWNSLHSVPHRYAGSLRSVVFADIELENLIWALRLRRYYAMSPEDTEARLIHLKGANATGTAFAALALRPDLRSDWEGWRWEDCLNQSIAGPEAWQLDVRSLEQCLRRRRFGELRRALHLEPFTFVPLYSFFRIKEYETAAIFAVIEGVHLEARAGEIGEFVYGLTEHAS